MGNLEYQTFPSATVTVSYKTEPSADFMIPSGPVKDLEKLWNNCLFYCCVYILALPSMVEVKFTCDPTGLERVSVLWKWSFMKTTRYCSFSYNHKENLTYFFSLVFFSCVKFNEFEWQGNNLEHDNKTRVNELKMRQATLKF